jgi:hypothetical protein
MKRIPSLCLLLALLSACTSSSNGGGASANQDGGLDATSGGDDAGVADDGSAADGDAGVPDTFAWAQVFPAGSGSAVTAMASDASGVVVVGQITGAAVIGSTTLTSTAGEGNAFVAKLDPTGKVLWAKIASGSSSIFEAVALDASGNITISGAEYGDAPGPITFAGATLSPNTSGTIGGSSVGSAGGLLGRLDASGNVTWMKLGETTTAIDFGSLAFSGTHVVVAGALNGNAAFGPGETLPAICSNATNECVFFAAYDAATGTPQWGLLAPSTPARGNGAADPHQVHVGTDAAGNIFLGIGGYFEGAGSTDDTELVVNKYDPTGALSWNKVFTSSTGDTPNLQGFAVDTTGNSYLLGSGATSLDGNTSSSFIAKLDPTGNTSWVQSLQSSPVGTTGLALGASLLTFGNGDDPSGILSGSNTLTPMNLGAFDPAAGKLTSSVVCGIAGGQGEAVAVDAAATYVAGEGTSPGIFGHVQIPAAADAGSGGIFVAKLK